MRFTKSALTAALAMAVIGTIARAQTDKEAAKDNSNPTEVFYLANVGVGDAEQIAHTLRDLLDPRDKIDIVHGQGALFVQAPAAQLVLAKTLLDEMSKTTTRPTQVFYLNNIGTSDSTDIVTAVRNMLDPEDKVYLVQAQNALFVQATPSQLALTKTLLDDLDRAKRTFRLTYTITEVDDGKRVGTQHFSMVLVSGQQTTMKQGSKIPIATGTTSENGSTSTQTQFTYLDVGLNFNATLDESVNGVRLRSKAEQSSLGADKTIVGVQEPVVRQTVIEGSSILTPGKPLILGSLDIPDSTRRLDIEVVMEVVK